MYTPIHVDLRRRAAVGSRTPVIQRWLATVGERRHEVAVERLGDGATRRFRVTIDGRERTLDALPIPGGAWSLLDATSGATGLVDLEGPAPKVIAHAGGVSFAIELSDARRARAAALLPARAADGPLSVRAAMPGKVVKIHVQVGDAVAAGQAVVVMEAMKMENELRSARAGTVSEITTREGANVDAGAVLVVVT